MAEELATRPQALSLERAVVEEPLRIFFPLILLIGKNLSHTYMDDLRGAMNAVGSAAQLAGKLGEQAYSIMSNSRVTSGIKNAASKAYETAKQLKNSVPIGSIGTKALNAARTFKNAVRDKVNPQAIANSAAKAASFIGQAAQGAGSKMAQVGSTIKNTFNRYGGWKGFGQRALAPTNVGNRTNPFRVPVPAWYAAATGKMPQRSIFMPNTPPPPPSSSWWGRGGVKKRNRTFRKKSRKGTRRR